MADIIKSLLMPFLYLVFAPVLGVLISDSRKAQRWLFALMVSMPCWPPGRFTFMVLSHEFYRGHAKGMETSLIEIFGLALVVASARNKDGRWRLMAPGSVLFLLYCFLCSLSFFAAEDKMYFLLAASRWFKGVLILMGAFHVIRGAEDLRWGLRSAAISLIYYAFLCLKLRYVDGYFQIKGYFEHQNPMAMWVYMACVPLLAAGLAPQTKKGEAMLYLGGVAAGALCTLLTVSRAALAIYAAGCALVVVMAWLRGPTARVVGITTGAVLGACFALLFAMDGLNSRLDSMANSESASEFDLRDILNMQSHAMLKDSPIGIGWNNFGVMNSRPVGAKYSAILEDWDESRGFAIVDENYYGNPLTESLYWLILSETGYPGMIGFVLFISSTLYVASVTWWRHPKQFVGIMAGGFLVTFVLCYAHGKVERIVVQPKNLSQWLTSCGIAGALWWRRQLWVRAELPVKPNPFRLR